MNTIKTLAIASLVTFSTLAFTACGGATSTTEAATDSTAVNVEETVIDETADDASNMMQQTDSAAKTAADSTKTGM